MVGAVGDDDLGGAAVAALARRGHRRRARRAVDAPTGVALIVVDAAGENQIAVASGANAELSVDSSTCTGDGVMLLGHEVSAEVVERAAARAGRRPAGASS